MDNFSNIQWTDKTWNPWSGCTKVGPGCERCYMFREKERRNEDPTIVIRASKWTFQSPLRWKSNFMVFTCSMSDFFHKDADAWRDEAWEIIKRTPHLTYQILTKRPQRIKQHLPADWGKGYPNVWLGVSGEDELNTNKRVKILLKVPAMIHFLSAEPLLEEIMSGKNKGLLKELDWIIVGGESGYKKGPYAYRTTKLGWIKSIVDYGQQEGIAIFVKQVGSHYHFITPFLKDWHGGEIQQWPSRWEPIKMRQYPQFTPAKVIHPTPNVKQLKLKLK